VSPQPKIGEATSGDQHEGLILIIENKRVPPLPNVPENGGDNCSFFNVVAAASEEVGEAGDATCIEVEVEEVPNFTRSRTSQEQVVDILLKRA
jgi:hypothetical protein